MTEYRPLPPGYSFGSGGGGFNDEEPEYGPAQHWDEFATQPLPVMRRIGWLQRLKWRWRQWRLKPITVVVSEPSRVAIEARRALLLPAAPPPIPVPVALRSVPFSMPSEVEKEKLEKLLNAVMFHQTQHFGATLGRRMSPPEIDTLRHSLRGAFNQAREIGMLHANDARRTHDLANRESAGPTRNMRKTLRRNVTEEIDSDELKRMVDAAKLQVPPPRGK